MTLADRYLCRKFLTWFLWLSLGIFGLVFTADLIELMRQTAGDDVPFRLTLWLAVLKLPMLAEKLLPIIILLAMLLGVLNQRQELTVLRAAGCSLKRTLRPLLLVAASIGVITMVVLNTLNVYASVRLEDLREQHIDKTPMEQRAFALRVPLADGSALLYSNHSRPAKGRLYGVTMLRFDENFAFKLRVDAKKALLQEGECWLLQYGSIVTADAPLAKPETAYCLPTDMTLQGLRDYAASPDSLTIWQLPPFIQQQRDDGFAATQYSLQFQRLLAMPLFYVSMILLAAALALKPQQRGGIWPALLFSILIGFILYFAGDVLLAMGMSGKLPTIIAAWAMPGALALFAVAVIVQRDYTT